MRRLSRDDERLTDSPDAVALASSGDVNVGLLVRHAFRSFQRRLQEVTVPFGLSAAEFRVLRALETGGALTQLRIAALAGMDRPYAALIAKQLREKRLVEATPDAVDGRRVLLNLTSQGAAIAEAIGQQLTAVNRTAIAGVEPSELAIFCDVIARIRRSLDSDPDA